MSAGGVSPAHSIADDDGPESCSRSPRVCAESPPASSSSQSSSYAKPDQRRHHLPSHETHAIVVIDGIGRGTDDALLSVDELALELRNQQLQDLQSKRQHLELIRVCDPISTASRGTEHEHVLARALARVMIVLMLEAVRMRSPLTVTVSKLGRFER